MLKSKHFYIRKAHRYLGVFLGLQFLLWTASGIYFSWTDINEIHGDLQHQHPRHLLAASNFVSPSIALNSISQKIDSIHKIEVVNILQKPFYSIYYFIGDSLKAVLADAQTGKLRQPVSKEEAVKIAAESFAGQPALQTAEYITTVGDNDEYREKPLPAWKVSFTHQSNTNVYVSTETGKVETFRNQKWRTYDLLWMFHTMGYGNRDNTNNSVLRIFSLLGIITVLSGFALFIVSSKWFNKNKKVIDNNRLKAVPLKAKSKRTK